MMQTKARKSALPEPLEADLQRQLVEYLGLIAVQNSFLFFAVPNEAVGKLHSMAGMSRMARLKRMGLRSGVADIVLVKKGRAYFLELKRATGRVLNAQAEFAAEASSVGAHYAIARTFDDALNVLRSWKLLP